MSRFTVRPIRIVAFIALVLADLFVYLVLSLFFMGYEDFYDQSKGTWMSLQSMTTKEKVIYLAIDFWYIANIALIIWTCYRVYKSFKNRKVTNAR
jgi:hypothetical protein